MDVLLNEQLDKPVAKKSNTLPDFSFGGMKQGCQFFH